MMHSIGLILHGFAGESNWQEAPRFRPIRPPPNGHSGDQKGHEAENFNVAHRLRALMPVRLRLAKVSL